MKKSNFDDYTIDQLHQLKADIDAEIAHREEKQEKDKQARQKVLETLQEIGMTLPEFLDLAGEGARSSKKATSGKRGTVAPKYRNPNNAEETWTGRGRKPKWVEAFINGGGSMEQIAI